MVHSRRGRASQRLVRRPTYSPAAAVNRRGKGEAVRRRAGDLVRAYRDNDLLTFASAIAFQVVSALAPALLFVLGALGFLHLEDIYTRDVAPHLRDNVSAAAFKVLDDTVRKVLGARQLFWVTAGALLAVWQVSGAVRAVMGAFNVIYDVKEDRGLGRRLLLSFALSVAVGLCALGAIASVTLAPLLYGSLGGLLTVLSLVGRWLLAGALLLLAVGLLVRHAPACRQPIGWVSFGSLLVIGAWVAMSVGFAFYLREIASYGSVFGNLATFVVLVAYLYLSCIVFLGGAQADALVREEVEGNPSGN